MSVNQPSDAGVAALLSGDGPPVAPVVLRVDKIRSIKQVMQVMSGGEREYTYYQFALSDGDGKQCVAMLQSQINHWVEERGVAAGSLICVRRWMVTTDKDVSMQEISTAE